VIAGYPHDLSDTREGNMSPQTDAERLRRQNSPTFHPVQTTAWRKTVTRHERPLCSYDAAKEIGFHGGITSETRGGNNLCGHFEELIIISNFQNAYSTSELDGDPACSFFVTAACRFLPACLPAYILTYLPTATLETMPTFQAHQLRSPRVISTIFAKR